MCLCIFDRSSRRRRSKHILSCRSWQAHWNEPFSTTIGLDKMESQSLICNNILFPSFLGSSSLLVFSTLRGYSHCFQLMRIMRHSARPSEFFLQRSIPGGRVLCPRTCQTLSLLNGILGLRLQQWRLVRWLPDRITACTARYVVNSSWTARRARLYDVVDEGPSHCWCCLCYAHTAAPISFRKLPHFHFRISGNTALNKSDFFFRCKI